MITNFFSNVNENFSKKMLTSFRKDNIKSFFLIEVSNNSYLNTLLSNNSKKKLVSTIWNYTKIDPKTNTNYNYLYKPDNILTNDQNLEYYFIRKSKNFNKGRYSRNRQVYRTGVYMCFYINVIALYLL